MSKDLITTSTHPNQWNATRVNGAEGGADPMSIVCWGDGQTSSCQPLGRSSSATGISANHEGMPQGYHTHTQVTHGYCTTTTGATVALAKKQQRKDLPGTSAPRVQSPLIPHIQWLSFWANRKCWKTPPLRTEQPCVTYRQKFLSGEALSSWFHHLEWNFLEGT